MSKNKLPLPEWIKRLESRLNHPLSVLFAMTHLDAAAATWINAMFEP